MAKNQVINDNSLRAPICMMSLAANCGLYPWGVSRTPNLPMNCHSNFSKQISHFHRPFAASKANCGWYLDAAVSALRTLDRKIFRSNCNFSNEQAESTYFRQFAKMDNIFLILNWICDGILAVITKGLALQYGARSRVPSTKTKIYKNFAAKKNLLRFISACPCVLEVLRIKSIRTGIWIFGP